MCHPSLSGDKELIEVSTSLLIFIARASVIARFVVIGDATKVCSSANIFPNICRHKAKTADHPTGAMIKIISVRIKDGSLLMSWMQQDH